MSAEDPRCQCDCSETYQSLARLLDDADCSPQTRERLRAQIERCPECFARLGLEEEVRSLLRKCCAQQAPQTLYERVSFSIRTVRIERRG